VIFDLDKESVTILIKYNTKELPKCCVIKDILCTEPLSTILLTSQTSKMPTYLHPSTKIFSFNTRILLGSIGSQNPTEVV
jgi:hypothetical protein